MTTDLKFGVFVPQGWRIDLAGIDPAEQWEVMSRLAKRADAGPWESIWVFDHFHTTPEPTQEATHEAWTLMAAFAAVTRRVRLGQMCTCMAYRNPTYLAKVAATVDVVSAGRVEMGIGAGWYEHEWRAYGYGFPRAAVRLGMLDEGVQIMQQAWTHGVATLQGDHYQVKDAIISPKPLQPGGIPLWIAGGGEKVTLRIAAKYARYTNFHTEVFAQKSAILREHCAAVGTDYDAIVRSSNLRIVIAETEAGVEDRLKRLGDHYARYVSPAAGEKIVAEYRKSPGTGTPEQIAERLQALVSQGLGYAITSFHESAYDTSGIELFESTVIPDLLR
jgi:F420-dependent oxidoreductase-like protein